LEYLKCEEDPCLASGIFNKRRIVPIFLCI
jgi:hypothetical protein